jgi:hypothetical protein
MSNLFQNLEMEAFRKGITPRTAESRDWFRKKAQSLRRVNRNTIMKEEPIELKSTFQPGAMAMFFYNPKTKDKLPYYDSFPLTIIVDKAEGGFYGMNLHYLPPILRAKFLDVLLDNTNNKYYDEKTRFAVNYNYLKNSARTKYFKPCFKHYLTSHVKSRFAVVPAPEWEIATFLPLADWQKQSGSKVYADSRRMLR